MPTLNPPALRYHRLWTALGWIFVALIIYLSLMHPPRGVIAAAFDIGHLFAYAWLMIWFAQIHRPTATRFAIGAALCAMGVALEFAQGMTGYRTFDYADMRMDALGVGVGLLLARTPAQHLLRGLEQHLTR